MWKSLANISLSFSHFGIAFRCSIPAFGIFLIDSFSLVHLIVPLIIHLAKKPQQNSIGRFNWIFSMKFSENWCVWNVSGWLVHLDTYLQMQTEWKFILILNMKNGKRPKNMKIQWWKKWWMKLNLLFILNWRTQCHFDRNEKKYGGV